MPEMDDEARQQALLTALTTEHFVLQTARATTVNEANGRSSLYLTAVSSALVALGFVAQTGNRFESLAAAVLPALFLLGEFTFVRLLETSIADWLLFQRIGRIRGYYRTLHPQAEEFLADDAPATLLLRTSPGQVLLTSASMVAAINAIIGGAGVTLLLTSLGVTGPRAALALGVAFALACFAGHVAFQIRQFRQASPEEGAEGAPSARLPV